MADKEKAIAEMEPGIAPALDHMLVVIHPFGDYRRGDQIADAEEIAAVEASESAHHCRRAFPQ